MTTISAVTAASASPISNFQSFRQAFGQLANALQSGNTTAAQSALSTLSASPLAQGNGPFAQALQQISNDLQAGDPASLADAQKTLASLQEQFQAHRGHHHHHGGGGETQAASNTSNVSGPSNSNSSNASDPDGDGDNDTTTNILQISITVESDNKVDIKA